MPRTIFPDDRVFVEERTVDIEGHECTVEVFGEEYSYLFGLWTHIGRHVRIEVPYLYDGEHASKKYIHSKERAGTSPELPNKEEHIEETVAEAREWLQGRSEIREAVSQ